MRILTILMIFKGLKVVTEQKIVLQVLLKRSPQFDPIEIENFGSWYLSELVLIACNKLSLIIYANQLLKRY